jgi:Flp pilus assembly protein TadG
MMMRSSARGETLVEYALALTLFLMTLFGITQFGLAVWQFNMISNLAQEGARWASVRGGGSASPASTADVQNYVRSRGVGISGLSVTTTAADVNTRACTSSAIAPSAMGSGGGLCVRVQKMVAFSRLIPAGPLRLESTAQMIMAR